MEGEISQGQSSGLSQLIANTQYQTVAVDPSAGVSIENPQEAVKLVEAQQLQEPTAQTQVQTPSVVNPQTEPLNPAAVPSQVAQPVAPVYTPPVQRQPDPELSRAQADRDTAYKMLSLMASNAMKAEEKAITDNQDLSEPERRAAIAELKLSRIEAANKRLQLENKQAVQASYETNEQIAHRQVANTIAYRHGVPAEDIPLLLQSPTFEDMQVLAARLGAGARQAVQDQKQETRQQIVSSGIHVAGGANAGPIVPEAPKQRTGDLKSYIRSVGYTTVPISQ